jgi:hypothetical protein
MKSLIHDQEQATAISFVFFCSAFGPVPTGKKNWRRLPVFGRARSEAHR